MLVMANFCCALSWHIQNYRHRPSAALQFVRNYILVILRCCNEFLSYSQIRHLSWPSVPNVHTQHRAMSLHPSQNLVEHKMWALLLNFCGLTLSCPVFSFVKGNLLSLHRWCIASWSATEATKIKRLVLASLECSMVLNMCNAQQSWHYKHTYFKYVHE